MHQSCYRKSAPAHSSRPIRARRCADVTGTCRIKEVASNHTMPPILGSKKIQICMNLVHPFLDINEWRFTWQDARSCLVFKSWLGLNELVRMQGFAYMVFSSVHNLIACQTMRRKEPTTFRGRQVVPINRRRNSSHYKLEVAKDSLKYSSVRMRSWVLSALQSRRLKFKGSRNVITSRSGQSSADFYSM